MFIPWRLHANNTQLSEPPVTPVNLPSLLAKVWFPSKRFHLVKMYAPSSNSAHCLFFSLGGA